MKYVAARGCNLNGLFQAAIIRIGLNEMRAFSKRLSPSVREDTFFESCGMADLIATCCKTSVYIPLFIYFFVFSVSILYGFPMTVGGRNRKVAEAFAIHGGQRYMF